MRGSLSLAQTDSSEARLSNRWLNSTRDSGAPIEPTRISGLGNPTSFCRASHLLDSLKRSAFFPKGTSNEKRAMISMRHLQTSRSNANADRRHRLHQGGVTFGGTTFRVCADVATGSRHP